MVVVVLVALKQFDTLWTRLKSVGLLDFDLLHTYPGFSWRPPCICDMHNNAKFSPYPQPAQRISCVVCVGLLSCTIYSMGRAAEPVVAEGQPSSAFYCRSSTAAAARTGDRPSHKAGTNVYACDCMLGPTEQ